MKEIKIKITDTEYEILKEMAELISEENITITPNRIIQQFISDLTCSTNSGGSDERHNAAEWFNRSRYNF